jgi:hypothetical protein
MYMWLFKSFFYFFYLFSYKKLNPTLPTHILFLGHEYVAVDALSKAATNFQPAVRLDPHHYNAWLDPRTRRRVGGILKINAFSPFELKDSKFILI